MGNGDSAVRYLPKGKFLESAVKTFGLVSVPLCGVVREDGKLWAGTDGGQIVQVSNRGGRQLIYEGNRWIEHLVRDPDSGICACASGREVILLDEQGDVIKVYRDHPSTITGIRFSSSGKRLAVSHYDGVTVWQISSGKRVNQLRWHGSHTAIAWSPDDRYIVTATQDKELHGWRMPSAVDVKMSGYPTKIRSIDWTADSRYLVASGADTVTSWNFEGNGPSGKPPMEFGYVFNGIVTQVATHPENCIVAAGYSNGTVLIGSIEHSNAWIARPPGGGAITSLTWQENRGLLAGTEDGAITLMQLERGFCEDMFA